VSLPEPTKVPCVECPWRRKAARGWLGSLTAEEWVQAAHGEAAIACHKTIDQDNEDDHVWVEGERQCGGAARYRANVFKLPHNPGVAVGPRDPNVFASPAEFVQHHTRPEEATRR